MQKADACVAGCLLKPQAEAWGYMLSPLRGEEPATEDGLSTRETYPVTTLKRCFVRRSKQDQGAIDYHESHESHESNESNEWENKLIPSIAIIGIPPSVPSV